MIKTSYKPYKGGGGPDQNQVEWNNAHMTIMLISNGYKVENVEDSKIEGLRVIEITRNDILLGYVSYDRYGYVLEFETHTNVKEGDQVTDLEVLGLLVKQQRAIILEGIDLVMGDLGIQMQAIHELFDTSDDILREYPIVKRLSNLAWDINSIIESHNKPEEIPEETPKKVKDLTLNIKPFEDVKVGDIGLHYDTHEHLGKIVWKGGLRERVSSGRTPSDKDFFENLSAQEIWELEFVEISMDNPVEKVLFIYDGDPSSAIVLIN